MNHLFYGELNFRQKKKKEPRRLVKLLHTRKIITIFISTFIIILYLTQKKKKFIK